MKALQRKLLIEQLDKKISNVSGLDAVSPPAQGWIHAIRVALNMSLRQLGERLGMTAQGAKEIERREALESITLKSLREAAQALNLKLVYGFVPQDATLEKMVEKRAQELARTIVLRTSASMALEDQRNSAERIDKAIQEKAAELKADLPTYLWN